MPNVCEWKYEIQITCSLLKTYDQWGLKVAAGLDEATESERMVETWILDFKPAESYGPL